MFIFKGTKKILLLAAVGFSAGILNGLLGAGGGILITYCLAYFLKERECSKNCIFSNALATMLPISVFSALFYYVKGHITFNTEILYFIISAILGGACGALLLKRLNFKIVNLLFTAIVIYSGFSMLLR